MPPAHSTNLSMQVSLTGFLLPLFSMFVFLLLCEWKRNFSFRLDGRGAVHRLPRAFSVLAKTIRVWWIYERVSQWWIVIVIVYLWSDMELSLNEIIWFISESRIFANFSFESWCVVAAWIDDGPSSCIASSKPSY